MILRPLTAGPSGAQRRVVTRSPALRHTIKLCEPGLSPLSPNPQSPHFELLISIGDAPGIRHVVQLWILKRANVKFEGLPDRRGPMPVVLILPILESPQPAPWRKRRASPRGIG